MCFNFYTVLQRNTNPYMPFMHICTITITHFLSYIPHSESVTSRLRWHTIFQSALPSSWLHQLKCLGVSLLLVSVVAIWKNDTEDLPSDLMNNRNLLAKEMILHLSLHFFYFIVEFCIKYNPCLRDLLFARNRNVPHSVLNHRNHVSCDNKHLENMICSRSVRLPSWY